METLKMLDIFLADEHAWEMYITGPAGTGKTTETGAVAKHLNSLGISYLVCAQTHKACGVLEKKLPQGTSISTLHSYLKKRPGINEHATKTCHVNINTAAGGSERYTLVIVDEYSMVGEKDYMDLVAMQDPHDGEDTVKIKVLYVGDPYQLPPVGDLQTIKPKEPYWVKLSKVHRTDRQDLLDAMTNIVEMIKGADVEPIRSSENITRGLDIAEVYKKDSELNKVVLAWTNKAVQELNAKIEGRTKPEVSDSLWCPTLRHEVKVVDFMHPLNVASILTPTGQLSLGTKYKTLEQLFTLDGIKFVLVHNMTLHQDCILAYVFGHESYKKMLKGLTDVAVEANREIKTISGAQSPAVWARQNYNSSKAKRRAKAWRELLTFKSSVVCLDFYHAMTVHKSQGSTYKHVYIDCKDLAKCAEKNLTLYLKLFYVALSRTSKRVFTN